MAWLNGKPKAKCSGQLCELLVDLRLLREAAMLVVEEVVTKLHLLNSMTIEHPVHIVVASLLKLQQKGIYPIVRRRRWILIREVGPHSILEVGNSR